MKKFLSLVLALVMTMSLVTISAGAKDFTDDSKINYQEAVDVISAVKVVDGYEDGSFNPTSTLTRGAAAKIICNLILGPTTASALVADAAPYKDVPANSTFAGYIAFCSKEGIISGYADGTFRPGNTLTSYAFMKMLLGALGYDQEVEGYTGANWSINVAKRALNLGLDDGLAEDFNGMKAVTREEACLYALNTLKATMVEYESKTTVTVGGAEVVLAGSKAEDVYNYAANETIKDDNKMQFAEKYFTNLKLNDEARDDFYRPSNQWKVKADEIGTYPQTPDLSYTEGVESGDIYSDLGSKVAKANVTVYIDGKKEPTQALAIAKGDETDVGVSGNGVLTEVYYDADAETADIIQINTYVGTVDKTVKATASKDAYIVIGPETAPTGVGAVNYETDETFADDTVVLYTYAKDAKEVKSVVEAEKVTGTVTRAENKTTNNEESQNVTIDGTVYKATKIFAGVEVGSVTVKEEYDLYLDTYGYMIKVEAVADLSSDYALVLKTEGTTDNKVNGTIGNSNRAQLVFADGTTGIVPTAKDYSDGSTNEIEEGTIVTYRKDADGVYTLREVTTTQTASDDDAFELVNNRARIDVKDDDDNEFTTAYGNSASTFVIYNNNDDDWDAYTGVKNAPSVAAKDLSTPADSIQHDQKETVTAYYYIKSGMVKVMFIVPDADALVDNAGSKLMYIAVGSVSNLIHDADGDYYEYAAIIDNEIKTIKVDYSEGKELNGFYKGYSIDKYGVYDNLTANAQAADANGETNGTSTYFHTTTGVSKTSEDYTVTFGSNTYTVDDDAKIYYVDEDDEITVSSYKSIVKDANDEAFVIVKDNMIDTLIIVAVDDDEEPVVDTTAYYSIGIVGTSAGSKNVQVVLYKADKDGNRTSGALTKAELKALKITDADITVTTADDARNLKYGEGETGSYYVSSTATTATQWAFINSAIAYFDGYQYDGNVGGFVAAYGNTAGFMKIHLDNYLFEGKLTVSIANVGENSFHSAEVTLPLEP